MVEALQSTYGGRSHCNGFSLMGYQLFQRVAADGYVFCVHLVPFYLFTFDRLEGSGPYVQGQFFQFYTFLAQGVQNAWREVQSGCRGGHRAFNFGINGLVGLFVALLRLPVQVGGDGQFSEYFENIGKCYFRIVPAEVHPMAGSMAGPALGGQRKRLAFYDHLTFQHSFFPFLQISYHAKPGGMFRLLEIEGIVIGTDRFETEHLDECSRLFVEMQACLDDFGVIENHQAVCRQVVGQGCEHIFENLAMPV